MNELRMCMVTMHIECTHWLINGIIISPSKCQYVFLPEWIFTWQINCNIKSEWVADTCMCIRGVFSDRRHGTQWQATENFLLVMKDRILSDRRHTKFLKCDRWHKNLMMGQRSILIVTGEICRQFPYSDKWHRPLPLKGPYTVVDSYLLTWCVYHTLLITVILGVCGFIASML